MEAVTKGACSEMSKLYRCPQCGTTIVLDLGGGGISNFKGGHCSGSEDEPHTSTELERPDNE